MKSLEPGISDKLNPQPKKPWKSPELEILNCNETATYSFPGPSPDDIALIS